MADVAFLRMNMIRLATARFAGIASMMRTRNGEGNAKINRVFFFQIQLEPSPRDVYILTS